MALRCQFESRLSQIIRRGGIMTRTPRCPAVHSTPDMQLCKPTFNHAPNRRCGRRLKLFVFLHNVTRATRPTIVVPRTHLLWYATLQHDPTTPDSLSPTTAPCAVPPTSSHPTLLRLRARYYSEGPERIAPEFIASHFERSVPMLGRRGGGFILDTNALHRGEPFGEATRTVVVLEVRSKHDGTKMKN